MADLTIIYPVLAMVALTFIVWLRMFQQRGAHIKQTPPRSEDFASREAAMRYFAPVENPAGNFINLFEMPVLFFALVPLLLITTTASHTQVALAWVYVVARALHSWVHVNGGAVMLRARCYVLSCAILMAMWIGFTLDLLTGPLVVS